MTFHNSNDNDNSNNLSPIDKIELKPIDLESINKKNKNINKEKRFSIGGWFNIFNKNFEIKFKWRF